MARYDKYEPLAGGFRAPLAADWLEADLNKVVGIGIDANGGVVKGAGTTGVVAVLILTKVRKAGEIVDNMSDGEIVELAGTPGKSYYSTAAGVVSSTSAVGSTKVGHTVEGDRLIVRVAGSVVAA